MENEEIVENREGKCPSYLRMHDEEKTMDDEWNGNLFLGDNLPHKKNMFFKNDGLPQYEFDYHTLPFPMH